MMYEYEDLGFSDGVLGVGTGKPGMMRYDGNEILIPRAILN